MASVGIDLGTTYSAVATFDKASGTIKILKNDIGEECTPSVVCIENGTVTIGQAAKDLQAAGNTNTAAFYKSMMGEANFSCYLDGEEYSAEKLSAMFLTELKRQIEEANSISIDSAVITVPAYFNEAQRLATIRAGEAAGMRILKLINEPTSAIIAYGLTGAGQKNVMVYDLGGGTFDVTIAHIDGTKVDVMATNGNHQLGGKDWDAVITEEIVTRFFDEFGIQLTDYEDVMNELAVKCEKTKKVLTNVPVTQISVQCEGFYGKYDISRELFEEKTKIQLAETTLLITKCFDEITKTTGKPFGWSSLDEVVLVGGSTRMPQISSMITREMGRPPIIIGNKVDTIVASGAAMQASICNEGSITLSANSGFVRNAPKAPGAPAPTLTICGESIKDVTSHSLGVLAFEADDSVELLNSIIIPKNSFVGKAYGRWYSTRSDKIFVYVMQGESENPYDCTLLYKFTVSGMTSGNTTKVELSLLYNQSGVVEVYAKTDAGATLAVKKESVTQSIADIIRSEQDAKRKAMSSKPKLDITFVVDTSGSMEDEPIIEARRSIDEFVAQLSNTDSFVTILNFADKCSYECKGVPIKDTAHIKRAIQGLQVDGKNGYCTDAQPLTELDKSFGSSSFAHSLLSRFGSSQSSSPRIIIVLTDGEWGNQSSETVAAGSLKKKGATIYAVGIGSADFDFLSKIASDGGAQKIDLSKLTSTFRDIASNIATQL